MYYDVFFSFLFCLPFIYINAQGYPQLILSGDYPDPSIMRDGEDYYMTHSPFYYMPGLLIWHSKDLVNWEPICRALPEFKGSAWAPDLLKYKDTYYIYYPSAGTNWVIWAKDIKGPWSKPIDLKISGIDPGHIADEQGNRYLYVDNGVVIRLTVDGLATVGEKRKVYDGWKYPDTWETECMCLESPKLIYHNGYYYLTSAQGVRQDRLQVTWLFLPVRGILLDHGKILLTILLYIHIVQQIIGGQKDMVHW